MLIHIHKNITITYIHPYHYKSHIRRPQPSAGGGHQRKTTDLRRITTSFMPSAKGFGEPSAFEACELCI